MINVIHLTNAEVVLCRVCLSNIAQGSVEIENGLIEGGEMLNEKIYRNGVTPEKD